MPSIIAGIYKGRAKRIGHPFASGTFGHNPNIQPYEYNPALGIKLLEEAGYKNGFTAELIFPAGGGTSGAMGRVAEVVAANLAKANIKITIASPDRTEHSRLVFTDGAMRDMGIAGHINQIGDADFVLNGYFDAKRRNFFFKDPKLPDMVAAQLSEVDPEKRQKLLWTLGEYLHDQAPWLHIAEVPLLYGVSNRLQFKPQPNQVLDFREVALTSK